MAKRNKIEVKFKCPKCGQYAKPNNESNNNFDCFDMVCKECNVRYEWEYYKNGEKIDG